MILSLKMSPLNPPCLYDDDERVGKLTRLAFEQTDSCLLQIHRFAATDEAHAGVLLKIFDPSPAAVIADVGCGVGRLAELMEERRPDLEFILINKSGEQLAMCPSKFERRMGVAEMLPLEVGEAEAIMATYVLGHVDLPQFIAECARVLMPGDPVYIYDLFKAVAGEECRLKSDLGYEERTVEETITAFESGGFLTERESGDTQLVPHDIAMLMPSRETLNNSVSSALVFEKL